MRLNVYVKVILLTLGVWLILYFSLNLLPSYVIRIFQSDLSNNDEINYFLYNESRQFSFEYNLLSVTDYNKLINISFEFTIINFACGNADPLLLILIHSAPTNFAKRKIIRDTWGENDEDVKVLFVLGTTISEDVEADIRNENSLHKDIIQGSFLDSYRNLTYKHTMALKYVVYHCPETKYILKTDDDIFVNTPLMRNFLRNDLSPYGAEKLLMCSVIHKAEPFRTYRSKWRVSFDEYPYKYYPTYCLGWYILYSPDVIFDFYREAQRSTYFWIDDVFVTGLVAEKINFINHTNISPLTLSQSVINFSYYFKPFLFGSADMNENDIRSLWKYVVNNPVPESIKETVKNENKY